MKTYDPNITFASQVVRITYQSWDYTGEFDIPIGGNCKGLTILNAAVSHHADQLYEEQGDGAVLILKRPAEDGDGEDTLEVDADEDTLEEMCVGLRIIIQTPEDAP